MHCVMLIILCRGLTDELWHSIAEGPVHFCSTLGIRVMGELVCYMLLSTYT